MEKLWIFHLSENTSWTKLIYYLPENIIRIIHAKLIVAETRDQRLIDCKNKILK